MILAFGNKARHGKDTAGEAIVNFYKLRNDSWAKHGFHRQIEQIAVQKVNFADALKKEVTAAIYAAGGIGNFMHYGRNFGFEGFKFPDWVQLDPNPQKDRLLPHGKHSKLLQYWGTEFRRKQDPEYWIKKWKDQVVGFKGISVTCDMRFINEAEAVKAVGGHTVNVTRMLKDDGSGKAVPYIDPSRDPWHASETELDGYNFDFYIKVVDGHVALVEQQAITLAEYLRTLES